MTSGRALRMPAMAILPARVACDGADAGDAFSDGTFVLADENNYTYDSALDIGAVEARLAQDVRFDWSALGTDIQGHPVDPAAIDQAFVLWFPNLDHAAVEAAVADDALVASDLQLVAWWDNEAGATECRLSDMLASGVAPFDPTQDFVDGSGSWLFRLVDDAVDTRMLAFVAATETSESDLVTIGDDSASLVFEANLHDLAAIAVAGEYARYTVDWSGVGVTGAGKAFNPSQVDEMLVARYDESVSEIESDFLDVELMAEEFYTWSVDGVQELDIGGTDDPTGFRAFTAGRWLLGLRCGSCANPAPHFLTVIDAE